MEYVPDTDGEKRRRDLPLRQNSKMGREENTMNNEFSFLIYKAENKDISVNAIIKDETVWLTQKAMSELFDVDKSTVSRHLKNIFAEGKLDEKVVVALFATTTPNGAMEEKTNSIMPSRGRQRLKSFMQMLMHKKNIWGCKLGKQRLTAEF